MSSSETMRLIATVKGCVQGVGYRYFAEAEANRLGLTGFVRNLPDGDVEVVAEGDERVLQAFAASLHTGPSSAVVNEINCLYTQPTNEFRDFTVRRWR